MTPTITDPATAPTVAPVIGKRARLRDGEVTMPMAPNTDTNPAYPVMEAWGSRTWTASGSYIPNWNNHPLDIIGILDDEAAPDPQPEAEVAAITGVRIGYELSVEAEDNRLHIEVMGGGVTLTPAEARALLSVLPGLIKIAEGK